MDYQVSCRPSTTSTQYSFYSLHNNHDLFGKPLWQYNFYSYLYYLHSMDLSWTFGVRGVCQILLLEREEAYNVSITVILNKELIWQFLMAILFKFYSGMTFAAVDRTKKNFWLFPPARYTIINLNISPAHTWGKAVHLMPVRRST